MLTQETGVDSGMDRIRQETGVDSGMDRHRRRVWIVKRVDTGENMWKME